MVVKCTGYLLVCSCLTVLVLVLYSWEGLYVALGTAVVQGVSKLGAPSRYLLQIAPGGQGQEEAAVAAAPAAGGSPVSALLVDTETRTLLERATSRLQCLGTSANEHFQTDRDVIDSLADLNSPNSGYVAVVSFREQQMKASENLFALQCWARTLRVNIVEPFTENSHLIVPLNTSQRTLLKFRDLFDLGIWQLLSVRHKFPPLTSWKTFLTRAPRQLIVVRFRYLKNVESKRLMDQNESVVHLAVDDTFKEGCRQMGQELARKIRFLTELYNFTVIRNVCVNFKNGDQLTQHQLRRHLYGGTDPGKVTVLIEEWRGFSYGNNGKRVSLSNACPLSSSVKPLSYTWPSRQLICDARRYRQRHMKTNNYITLMVRIEKILILNSSREYMVQCLKDTLKQWQLLKATHDINTTFLSMDIGSHGSFSLMGKHQNKYPLFDELYEEFLRAVLGPQATLRTWEMGFEEVASHKDSGYIGLLQKTLVAQSRCIVFTGGGLFQKHAKYMYERVVPSRKRCVAVVSECSKQMPAHSILLHAKK